MFLKEAIIIKIDLGCKNPYEILGIEKQANNKQIKKAYKKLASKYHPDNQDTGDEDVFKLITKAKNILLDPELRRLYDEFYIFESESDKMIYNKAVMEITNVFLMVIANNSDNIDMKSKLRDSFYRTNSAINTEIHSTKAKIMSYESSINRLNKSKISKSIKENVEAIIEKGKVELGKIKSKLIIIEKAEEILEEFGYDFDPPEEILSNNSFEIGTFTFTT